MSAELFSNPAEFPTDFPFRRVLDHGFVALIDVMGNDASIVQAARVSYGKGTKTVRGDKALISYLMRHAHTTPYEMVEFKFLMRLPVFVARQVVRHRTANINEYSGRYSIVPDRFWAPSLGAIADQDSVNRQGRADQLRELVEALPDPPAAVPCAYVEGESAVVVAKDGTGASRAALLDADHRRAFAPVWSGDDAQADLLPSECYAWWVERLLDWFPERRARLEEVRRTIVEHNERTYALYQKLMQQGVAREIARGVLPLTMYTEWYWKIDLHNLLHFLRLRMDPHAQFEVRCYAEAMAVWVKEHVPFAWEAFEKDRLRGVVLSRDEKELLAPVGEDAQRALLAGLHERGWRSRRLKESCRKLGIDERLVDEMWPPPPAEAGA